LPKGKGYSGSGAGMSHFYTGNHSGIPAAEMRKSVVVEVTGIRGVCPCRRARARDSDD
jgi:hypothetical protein